MPGPKAAILGAVGAALLVLLAVAAGYRALRPDDRPAAATAPTIPPSPAPPAPANGPATEAQQGFLHGRITTVDGVAYQGRLRWGGGQEAFWGDYFHGYKGENAWASQVPPERLPRESRPIAIFGLKIARRERPMRLVRPFMARFGDLTGIEVRGRDVRVTLKSGTRFHLDRLDASDFDDGVRVWDGRRGVVDLDSLRIRAIDFLATPRLGDAPSRLHGTVRTRQGDFTGFVEWDREAGVGTDELRGRTAEGELRLRFDSLRSVARRSRDSARVTLRDGREIVLSGAREVGHDNRGIAVDDRRYGRVLVSWDAFERVDFGDPGAYGSGPAYGDFPPGRPLTGSVTTRAGRRLAGRLVYDLDESETTETLDAPSRGVDYTIPFERIASIVPAGREERDAAPARVTLQDGEELPLEGTGDLGAGNAGLLVFVEGAPRPEYVPWSEVGRVDFDRPPAIPPPLDGR